MLLDRHLRFPNVRGARTIRMGGFGEPAFRRGFAALAERNLTFDANLRAEHGRELLALAEAFPSTKIVVDNMANPTSLDAARLDEWRVAMRRLGEAPNVFMKLSGLGMADHRWTRDTIRPWVQSALELFPADRCMFGTNWPVDSLYGPMSSLVRAIEAIVAEVGASGAHVFRRTAERAYRFGA
jgi:predicted TIM-barrel fold metal-dependent hydrolase